MFAHARAIEARSLAVAVVRTVGHITSISCEPKVTMTDACFANSFATAVIRTLSHPAIQAHPATLTNAATALRAVAMPTVARAKGSCAVGTKIRQVAKASAPFANTVAMTINILAGCIHIGLCAHTNAACFTTEAMQALAKALHTFTVATAFIRTHAHITIGVRPARIAVANALSFVAKTMVAAVVQTQCIIAVKACETRFARAVPLLNSGCIGIRKIVAYLNTTAMERAIVGAHTSTTVQACEPCLAVTNPFPTNTIATALIRADTNLALVTSETILAAATTVNTVLTG